MSFSWNSASSLVRWVSLVSGCASKHSAALSAASLVHRSGGIGVRGNMQIGHMAGKNGAVEAGDVEASLDIRRTALSSLNLSKHLTGHVSDSKHSSTGRLLQNL